jgi:Family of unknown function (DUF6504)
VPQERPGGERDNTVNVQARDDGRPVRFVWRGRLYTVRAILEHWIINREWWQDPDPLGYSGPSGPEPAHLDRAQLRPDHPEPELPEPELPEPELPEPELPEPELPEPSHPQPELPEPDISQPGVPEPVQPQPGLPELEFWRVEASPGQGMAAAVYELRRDAAIDAWTLRRTT